MTHPLFDTLIASAQRRISVVATERDDGDMHPLHVDAQVGPWWMLDQVHGVSVYSVAGGEPIVPTAAVGDVMVTNEVDVALAIWSADCAPLVLASDDGTVVAAHGGWRGLAAGIVDVAVDAAERSGGTIAAAVLGPLIHPCCYAFGQSDLDSVARGLDIAPELIAGRTATGAVALDVPVAMRAALARRGVALDVTGPCTGCDERWFSHRVRVDAERHATVVYVEAA